MASVHAQECAGGERVLVVHGTTFALIPRGAEKKRNGRDGKGEWIFFFSPITFAPREERSAGRIRDAVRSVSRRTLIFLALLQELQPTSSSCIKPVLTYVVFFCVHFSWRVEANFPWPLLLFRMAPRGDPRTYELL